jgi:hypothetical protein
VLWEGNCVVGGELCCGRGIVLWEGKRGIEAWEGNCVVGAQAASEGRCTGCWERLVS